MVYSEQSWEEKKLLDILTDKEMKEGVWGGDRCESFFQFIYFIYLFL